jgi:hypothetical protein
VWRQQLEIAQQKAEARANGRLSPLDPAPEPRPAAVNTATTPGRVDIRM